MSTDKFEVSKATGHHARLAALVGEWEGTAKVWFEPEKVEDEAPVTGTIKSILDGRFLLHEYHGSFKAKPISGIAIIGYSIQSDSFQCAWVDSFHMGTGILFSEAKAGDQLFSVLGTYGGPDMPEPWGWRTAFENPEKDKLIITAYNIEPGAEEVKATEMLYNRKV